LFSIICPDGDSAALFETVQCLVEFVKHRRPGRYQVDEVIENTLSTGQTFRNWGAITRFPSGDVSIQNHSSWSDLKPNARPWPTGTLDDPPTADRAGLSCLASQASRVCACAEMREQPSQLR
jgi:hypothetical protein